MQRKHDICHDMHEPKTIPSCETCGAREKSVFCSLNKVQVAENDRLKHSGAFKKGDYIFKEGNYAKGLHCVGSGKVKLVKNGVDGKEHIVRFSQEGGVMGYHSMLTGTKYSSSAIALEDTMVCFIPSSRFFQLLQDNNEFSLKMLELSAENWNNAAQLVTNMAQKTSKQRMAEMLLWLERTFGERKDGTIDISLSREDIANLVGTATEAAIRLLSELKKQSLIELKGKNIKLLEKESLATLAMLED